MASEHGLRQRRRKQEKTPVLDALLRSKAGIHDDGDSEHASDSEEGDPDDDASDELDEFLDDHVPYREFFKHRSAGGLVPKSCPKNYPGTRPPEEQSAEERWLRENLKESLKNKLKEESDPNNPKRIKADAIMKQAMDDRVNRKGRRKRQKENQSFAMFLFVGAAALLLAWIFEPDPFPEQRVYVPGFKDKRKRYVELPGNRPRPIKGGKHDVEQ